MKKVRLQYNIIPLIFLFGWILLSCTQQPSTSRHMLSQSEMDSFRIRAIHVFPNYYSISDLLNLLRDVEVVFVPDAMNSIENLEKYYDNDFLMAANIGVYMADIAYAWSFNEIKEALTCNIGTLALAERLEMARVFLDSFFQKYDDEEADVDTILSWIERDINEAVEQFPSEKKLELYSALLTGNFIEKLYLIYEMIKKCPEISATADLSMENLQKLIWIAAGQVKALEELNKQIDSYAIPEEMRLYKPELFNLETMMHEAVFLRDTCVVRTINIIQDPEFINLYQEVSRIRNSITNPVIGTTQ